MTLSDAITRVLRRTGLSTSSSDYQDRARENINMILAEIIPLVDWWWLDTTTTFDTVASTRTYQPISGNVSAWYSFVDQTNNWPLEIIGPDAYDSADPDRDWDGQPRAVLVSGMDTANNGYPTVDILPVPDAVYTIRVRYRKDIAEWTSANDASELLALGVPRIIESVLIYGATSLYLEDVGNESGAARESQNFSRAMKSAKRQNLRQQGNRRHRPTVEYDEALGVIDSSLVTAA